ncbi:MAG: hypothetical protein ACUVXI_13155 [bacterium]
MRGKGRGKTAFWGERTFQLTALGIGLAVMGGVSVAMYYLFSWVASAVVILLTACAILSVDAISVHIRIREERAHSRNLEEQASIFKHFLLGDGASVFDVLATNGDIADDDHKIQSVSWEVEVKGTTPEVCITIRGRNVSDRPTREILYRIVGNTGGDYDLMGCQVKDLGRAGSIGWKPELIRDERRVKTVRLTPLREIGMGEEFGLELRYHWFNSLSRDVDYFVFYFTNFLKGVDAARMKISFGFPVRRAMLYRVEYEDRKLTLALQEGQIHRDAADSSSYLWSRRNPRGVYVVLFEREMAWFRR